MDNNNNDYAYDYSDFVDNYAPPEEEEFIPPEENYIPPEYGDLGSPLPEETYQKEMENNYQSKRNYQEKNYQKNSSYQKNGYQNNSSQNFQKEDSYKKGNSQKSYKKDFAVRFEKEKFITKNGRCLIPVADKMVMVPEKEVHSDKKNENMRYAYIKKENQYMAFSLREDGNWHLSERPTGDDLFKAVQDQKSKTQQKNTYQSQPKNYQSQPKNYQSQPKNYQPNEYQQKKKNYNENKFPIRFNVKEMPFNGTDTLAPLGNIAVKVDRVMTDRRDPDMRYTYIDRDKDYDVFEKNASGQWEKSKSLNGKDIESNKPEVIITIPNDYKERLKNIYVVTPDLDSQKILAGEGNPMAKILPAESTEWLPYLTKNFSPIVKDAVIPYNEKFIVVNSNNIFKTKSGELKAKINTAENYNSLKIDGPFLNFSEKITGKELLQSKKAVPEKAKENSKENKKIELQF